MKTHNREYSRFRRKKLRSNLTPAEAYLWGHLKGRKLCGRKFRRQHSIFNYIVDFYCPGEKLIIELDGEVHFSEEAKEYDRIRTQVLEAEGFKVLCFENRMVFDLLPSVLEHIKSEFKK